MNKKMPDSPRLTVFSLCYNTGDYVIEGLQSFLDCHFDDYQLIVLDDCSKDDSPVKVERWLKENISSDKYSFIQHDVNLGICRSLNEVLSLAKGIYFSGICDDYWEPDRLDDLEYLDENPEIGMVFSNAKVIDSKSRLTGQLYGNSKFLTGIENEKRHLEELKKGNFIIPPACIYRTSVLKEVGGYDEKLSFEDWDMYLRLVKNGVRIKYIDHAKVRYRLHSQSFWQSRSLVLFKGLVDLFEKHDLHDHNGSFLPYLIHFRKMPIHFTSDAIMWMVKTRKWKVLLPSALCMLNMPDKLTRFTYKLFY